MFKTKFKSAVSVRQKVFNALVLAAIPALIALGIFVAISVVAAIVRGIGLPRMVMFAYIGSAAYAAGVGKISAKLLASGKRVLAALKSEGESSAQDTVPEDDSDDSED